MFTHSLVEVKVIKKKDETPRCRMQRVPGNIVAVELYVISLERSCK